MESFSAKIAQLLVDSSASYLALSSDIPQLIQQQQADERALALIRQLGLEWAREIATVNRVLDDGRYAGNSSFDFAAAAPVQTILRVVGDSMVLLAGVHSSKDLAEAPLIDPAKLQVALTRPNVVAWVRNNGSLELAQKLGADPFEARFASAKSLDS